MALGKLSFQVVLMRLPFYCSGNNTSLLSYGRLSVVQITENKSPYSGKFSVFSKLISNSIILEIFIGMES